MSAEEEWRLPERFRLDDPEKLSAAVEAQKELAKKIQSPFARLTPQEQERARALSLIEDHGLTLKALDSIIARALTCEEISEKELREYTAAKRARPHVAAQLAEAYASAGRFDEAARYDPAQRDYYLEVWAAVWRDDDEACACEPHRGAGKHSGLEVARRFVVKDVFSVKHAAVRHLVRCGACGHMNVTTLPKEIAEQRAHRARALEIAGSMKPSEAAKALEQVGHTAKNLLK